VMVEHGFRITVWASCALTEEVRRRFEEKGAA